MTNGTVSAPKASHSRMTNGTVSKQLGGSALTLQYKNGTGTGSQTLTLTPNIPVVTFAPGQPGQVIPGAHVVVMTLRQPNGSLTAERILVSKDGSVPPMSQRFPNGRNYFSIKPGTIIEGYHRRLLMGLDIGNCRGRLAGRTHGCDYHS